MVLSLVRAMQGGHWRYPPLRRRGGFVRAAAGVTVRGEGRASRVGR